MAYYKVMFRHNKKLISGNQTSETVKREDQKSRIVRYIKNTWVSPKKHQNQFLFIFDNLHGAKQWIKGYPNNRYIIYECEIGKPVYADNLLGTHIPLGTIFTDKVKIIRKVK